MSDEPHHRAARDRTADEQAALDRLAWERYGALSFETFAREHAKQDRHNEKARLFMRRYSGGPDAFRRAIERQTAASFRLSGLIP